MTHIAADPDPPGHAFYDRLQELLREAGFDAFVEQVCKPYYAQGWARRRCRRGGIFGCT